MSRELTTAANEDSHEDIAAQLGITKAAAKMRLSRARIMLRKRVGTYLDHVGAFVLFFIRKIETLPHRP